MGGTWADIPIWGAPTTWLWNLTSGCLTPSSAIPLMSVGSTSTGSITAATAGPSMTPAIKP